MILQIRTEICSQKKVLKNMVLKNMALKNTVFKTMVLKNAICKQFRIDFQSCSFQFEIEKYDF